MSILTTSPSCAASPIVISGTPQLFCAGPKSPMRRPTPDTLFIELKPTGFRQEQAIFVIR